MDAICDSMANGIEDGVAVEAATAVVAADLAAKLVLVLGKLFLEGGTAAVVVGGTDKVPTKCCGILLETLRLLGAKEEEEATH